MRLFESVVSSKALYGNEAWTLTKTHEQILSVTRRRMLRNMCGSRWRKDDVTWEDYIRDATEMSENVYFSNGGCDWVKAHRLRKWRFCAKFFRNHDQRWTKRVLNWRPPHGDGRRRGHPKLLWTDSIFQVLGSDWMEHAADQQLWSWFEWAYAQPDG